MKRTVFIYGLATAAILLLLKWVEYRFLARNMPLEAYIGLIALLFAVLGVWVGSRFTRPKIITLEHEFSLDENVLRELKISKREYEVLGLIAEGLSNKEIAERLFVSNSTVKTHTSNLFLKLEANRRTQALQKAKELGIIP